MWQLSTCGKTSACKKIRRLGPVKVHAKEMLLSDRCCVKCLSAVKKKRCRIRRTPFLAHRKCLDLFYRPCVFVSNLLWIWWKFAKMSNCVFDIKCVLLEQRRRCEEGLIRNGKLKLDAVWRWTVRSSGKVHTWFLHFAVFLRS